MAYFRKVCFGPLLQDDKIFEGVSTKVVGAKNFFSMLVQDSLPIDTTIAKCLSLLINFFLQNQLPLSPSAYGTQCHWAHIGMTGFNVVRAEEQKADVASST
jgi:hypothetical protein